MLSSGDEFDPKVLYSGPKPGKQRGRVVWDSRRNGPYVRRRDGPLGSERERVEAAVAKHADTISTN